MTLDAKAMFVAVAALAAGALFADKQTVDGVEWTYYTDVYAEIGNGTNPAIPKDTSGPIIVPATLGGRAVTGIGKYAFFECSDVTRVTLPDSVERIGYRAFSGCYGMESVILGNGLREIGMSAFYGCSGLAAVTIPQSVTSIQSNAFEGCSSLVSVRMPKIPVDDSVFKGCPKSLLITYWGEYSLTVRSCSSKYGSVSGSGWYESNKKVTISAQAKNGGVFAGWFADKACTEPLKFSGYDSRTPTVAIKMPANNLNVYARFVSADEAMNSLKFSSSTKKLAKTPLKMTAGTESSAKIVFTSLALPTVTAKNLPKGLNIDMTTGRISGVPTAPGEYTATVTVEDAAGNSIKQKVKFSITVAPWVNGTLYGKAKPGAKASDPRGYLKFTIGSKGEITGKVKYKNKWRAFTSSISHCTVSTATFSPKVKIGKSTFKPGAVKMTKVDMNGLELVEASDKGGAFVAQKKPGLVKADKPLDMLIGKSFKIKKSDNAKLGLKSGDKIVVKLGSGDKATVSGTVGGKKMSSLSWVVQASEKDSYGYTVYVDIIAPELKRDCTLILKVMLDDNGILENIFRIVQ